MKYKMDWPASRQRFTAFWQGEIVDRCCCAFYAPRNTLLDPAIALPRPPRDLQEKWLDPQYRLENILATFNHTYYGADAFPFHHIDLGPGDLGAFVGGGFRLAPDTVWFDVNLPIADWATRAPILMDWDSPLWKTAWEMTGLLCQNACGDYHVGITDLGGTLDIVASLRGADSLLLDLYDEPEAVKTAAAEVQTAWKQAYDRLMGLMAQYQQGSSAWMGLWCPGAWYPMQCDFSAMISPRMFDEFVAPDLAKEAKWFDRAAYHLDGPGQIRHLETLLDIEDICAIQCVPSVMLQNDGKFWQSYFNDEWLPVMKRIQERKRGLILTGIHPCELDALIENLRPEGLFFAMHLSSQDEAEAALKRIERWK